MTNLYQLTAKIHELLPKLNQKYSLEIKVESEYVYRFGNDGKEGAILAYAPYNYNSDANTTNWFSMSGVLYTDYGYQNYESDIIAIQAPQIRQILIALQEILGKNLEYYNLKKDTFVAKENIEYFHKLIPKSKAKALCQKWLDGLKPLFDLEPEMVLTELVEILENLLK